MDYKNIQLLEKSVGFAAENVTAKFTYPVKYICVIEKSFKRREKFHFKWKARIRHSCSGRDSSGIFERYFLLFSGANCSFMIHKGTYAGYEGRGRVRVGLCALEIWAFLFGVMKFLNSPLLSPRGKNIVRNY